MATLDRETKFDWDITVKDFIDTIVVDELHLPLSVAKAFYVAVILGGGCIDRRYTENELAAAGFQVSDRAQFAAVADQKETGH